MKYEDEVFSKESVIARRDNKLNTRKVNFNKGIEANKMKMRSELVTVILFAITVVTIVSLSLIDICGL